MKKTDRSYYGTEVLKGRELTKELREIVKGDRLTDLINMAIDQLNTPNSDDTFLKLGAIVATHNKDKVGFVETCLIEEMSELTKALCKIRRDEADFNNTIEELGHVILMCYALLSKYNFKHKAVIKEAEDAVRKMKASAIKSDDLFFDTWIYNYELEEVIDENN